MARSRLGNSSASSLLKQAQAAYERQQSYNDSIAAYEWELSDKTEADWGRYQGYLKERQGKTQDAMKKLEMEKKITSAYRAFNSSEIQRATLSVNYGDINKTQKYNSMFGLLQRAIANGDMELAGNIESQMASLSVQIQNEAAAAAGRGGGGGSADTALKKGYTAAKKEHDNAMKELDAQLSQGMITPQEYAGSMAEIQQARLQTIEMGKQQGVDSAENDAISLAADNKFQKYSSPQLLEKLNRDEPTMALAVDKNGNFTTVERKKSGIDTVLGRDGMRELIASQYQTGLLKNPGEDGLGGAFERFRKLGTDPNSKAGYSQAYELFGKGATDNQFKGQDLGGMILARDQVSGNYGVLSKDGKNFVALQRRGKDGMPINLSPDIQRTAIQLAKNNNEAKPISLGEKVSAFIGPNDPLKNAAEFYGDPAARFQDAKNGVNALSDTATKLMNPLGTAIGGLRSLAGINRAKSGNAQDFLQRGVDFITKKRAEEAAKVAAERARAAAEYQRQAIAQAQAEAARRVAQNSARPSVLYSKPVYTPAQSFNAAQAAAPGKSPESKAAYGFGELAGYNKILKNTGLFK